MSLYDKILKIYPSLTPQDFYPGTGTIVLWDNSDGKGPFIKSWKHPTLTEPTAAQLAAIV